MASNYWATLAAKRVNRRRVIAGSVGTMLGASLLAACGGQSDKGDAASGLVTKLVDTTTQAKAGGVLKISQPTDIQTFNPYVLNSPLGWHTARVYSAIVRRKAEVIAPYAAAIEPNLAESYEISPDKLQVTFKLRSNSKFDPRPPTNGRVATADDVVFSWKLYEATASRRADVANSVNPSAPIVSMTATDPQTLVVKTGFPDSTVLALIATGDKGGELFQVLPKEADGGFNIKEEMRGTGPFYLSDYRPSSGFTYKRNPGYWRQGRPFLEGMDVPIITEYAAALAQFKAGNLHTFDEIRAEDVIPTKKDAPAINMYQGQILSPTGHIFYGFDGGFEKSPFIDERVRQAFSMSLDRSLWIETFFNLANLRTEGVPFDMRWNSMINATQEGWWLDPQGKDFGDNAKYYQHDIAEAKKLLSAAGAPNGVDLESHHIVTADYGPAFPKQIEVMLGMAAESGFRIKTNPSNYLTDFRTKFADSKGKFDGICAANLSVITETGAWLGAVFNTRGSLFKGFDIAKNQGGGDAYLDDMTSKINREFDLKARWAMAHEIQRYAAKKQYLIPFPGGASGVKLAWPTVENKFVFQGGVEELDIWLNNDKAPIKKA